MRVPRTRRFAARVSAVVLLLGASGVLLGQAASEFEFVISVADAKGRPVTGLGPNDVRMSENGIAAQILEVAPYPVPVQLTIAVDNGPFSSDALSHYRTGVADLIKSLPADVQVTLITISPQPREVVRMTADRQRLLRGVNEFTPEPHAPRFTDAIVEFARRYRTEFEARHRLDSVPILVMITTTAPEAVSYEVPQISEAFGYLKQRKAKVYIASVAGLTGRNEVLTLANPNNQWSPGNPNPNAQATGTPASINDNRQAMIAAPLAKLTGGRYEALSGSNRLRTLLPEFGRDIATLHRKHANQMLVKVHRPGNLTGPLRNPRIEVLRDGLTGLVSLDGLP